MNARFGLILAVLIPTYILSPLSCNNVIADQNSTTSMSLPDCKNACINQQKRNLLVYQGSLILLVVVMLVILIFLAADQP